MPTNECKDQLTFSLRERSSCEKSDDCEDNEVCYLNTKVCKLYKYMSIMMDTNYFRNVSAISVLLKSQVLVFL